MNARMHDPSRRRLTAVGPTVPRVPGSPPAAARPRLFAQLAVRLPADVATRLRRHCERTGRSMNATVTAAVARYLDHLDRQGAADE
jgi:hypothetical protein